MSNNTRPNRRQHATPAPVAAAPVLVVPAAPVGELPTVEDPQVVADGVQADDSDSPEDIIAATLGETVIPTVDPLLPFAGILLAPPKNVRVFEDERTKQRSRTVAQGVAFCWGPGGTVSHIGVRFSVGVRWKAGDKQVEPYVSLPTQGGKFNPGIDTDDAATSDALEAWKAGVKALAIKWLAERAKKAAANPNPARAAVAPERMAVNATDLGLNL